MKIDCIIVEDEPLAMEQLQFYMASVPALNLLASFRNAADAQRFLQLNKVDLVFLDINMGNFSGIQLLEITRITAQVIFTTAYQQYAVKGFDLKVADYLLKPYSLERFTQAVHRVQTNLVNNESGKEKPFIFIKSKNRVEKIFLHEIIFIEGMRDYRKIHTVNNKIMTLKTFTDLEKEIPHEIVCRIHKSYMISLQHISSIEKDRVRINDVYLPVSETYKTVFFELATLQGLLKANKNR